MAQNQRLHPSIASLPMPPPALATKKPSFAAALAYGQQHSVGSNRPSTNGQDRTTAAHARRNERRDEPIGWGASQDQRMENQPYYPVENEVNRFPNPHIHSYDLDEYVRNTAYQHTARHQSATTVSISEANGDASLWSHSRQQDFNGGPQIVWPIQTPSIFLSRTTSATPGNMDDRTVERTEAYSSTSDETNEGISFDGPRREYDLSASPDHYCSHGGLSGNAVGDFEKESMSIPKSGSSSEWQLQLGETTEHARAGELSPSAYQNQSQYPYSYDEHKMAKTNHTVIRSREEHSPVSLADGFPLGSPRALSSTPPPILDCKFRDCNKTFQGDSRVGNLKRHMKYFHKALGNHQSKLQCSVSECLKTFKRSDARLKHERKKHPELHRQPPKLRRDTLSTNRVEGPTADHLGRLSASQVRGFPTDRV